MAVALLLAAVFTSDRLRGKRIMRTLFFMPSIIPAVAIFIIISGLIDPIPVDRADLPSISATPLYSLFPSSCRLDIGPGFLIMLGAMQAVPGNCTRPRVWMGPGRSTGSSTSPSRCVRRPSFLLIINMISAFGGVA